MRGTIFDIKRFAVHDGPGIRTVIFFKGCPLHCLWCHNPEGVATGPELMVRGERCAASCRKCLAAGPRGAFAKTGGKIAVDRSLCSPDNYARAADACLYEALELVGRTIGVEDLVAEVAKDSIFFEQSGGGVTLSGGEPLLQPEFLSGLVDALRESGFRTALDTSGLAAWEILERIARKTDLVLYDLKIMDDARHRKYTGVSNGPILENLRRLSRLGRPVWVRIPVVPGVNDDDGNIRATADFLKTLGHIERVSLLPYHLGGRTKAGNLGKEAEFATYGVPSPERLAAIARNLAGEGLPVQQGG